MKPKLQLIAQNVWRTTARLEDSELLVEPLPKAIKELRQTPSYFISKARALKNKNHGPFVILALPKSGGSWLSNLLSTVTGFAKSSKPYRKRDKPIEQERFPNMASVFQDFTALTAQSLENCRKKPLILHVHLPPNPTSLSAMQNANAKIVFLHRDPRAAIVSLYHHLKENNPKESGSLQGKTLDSVIDDYTPEFISYLNSWHELTSGFRNIFTLSYESLVQDTVSSMNSLLSCHQVNIPQKWTATCIAAYSQGVRELLTNNESSGILQTGLKIRKADPNSWRKELDAVQLDRLNMLCASLSPAFGTLDDGVSG